MRNLHSVYHLQIKVLKKYLIQDQNTAVVKKTQTKITKKPHPNSFKILKNTNSKITPTKPSQTPRSIIVCVCFYSFRSSKPECFAFQMSCPKLFSRSLLNTTVRAVTELNYASYFNRKPCCSIETLLKVKKQNC